MSVLVRTSSGFTLVEVLISLSIVSALALGVSSFLLQSSQEQVRLNADSTRMALINSLRFSAANAVALKRTAASMTYLKNCFCGVNTCLENRVVEFSLRDIAGAALSGVTSSPQRYDILGNPCNSPSAACVFEVTTTFECKGYQCGRGVYLEGDPTGRVTYRIALSAAARTRKELSYLRDVVGVPVDFSIKSLRVYSAEICN
ncbi:type II secretion system protein J [Bdellovibrio bacteriovorus]|uniref:PulJ/GspJ family protein n=1 Tax=Bdellovibrio bacteriovorus TaxID=959 RepID=UPI0035A665A3